MAVGSKSNNDHLNVQVFYTGAKLSQKKWIEKDLLVAFIVNLQN
jgi:hypothetical protein